MNSARPVSSAFLPRRPRRGGALAEFLVALVIVVLAGMLLFSGLYRMRQQSKARQWEKQLQDFALVFAEYRAKTGNWPDSASDLGPKLNELGWSRGSPFGGEYVWKPSATAGQPGAIALVAFHPTLPLTVTAEQLREIDRRLDDGDPATGRFRTGFNGWPLFQPAQTP